MQRLLVSVLAAVLFTAFSTGNVLAACGDGILDPGEGCDDGAQNGQVGSCCTVSCQCNVGSDGCGMVCSGGLLTCSAVTGTCHCVAALPTEPSVFANSGEVFSAQVTLTGGGTESSEVSGDLVVGIDGDLNRLSLRATSVGSSPDETGLMSIFWDPGSGAVKTVDEMTGVTTLEFVAGVHYPLIDQEFGLVPGDLDFDGNLEEAFAGTFTYQSSGSSITGDLQLTAAAVLSNVIDTILASNIVLGSVGAGNLCLEGKDCKKKEICIQPIVITEADGSNPTTCPSFNKARAIWQKCCKELEILPEKKLKDPSFKKLTMTGDAANRSTELKALITELIDDDAKVPSRNDCVELYCVQRFQKPAGTDNENVSGGAYACNRGRSTAKIIVQSDTDPTILGHEIGHTVGLRHPNQDDDTCMHPSMNNQDPVSEKQSKSNCDKGMRGNCRLPTVKEDCCKTWELDQ